MFVDGTHLSGPYKRTLVAACALDGDNHLFSFAYGVVSGEKTEEWVWFLSIIAECMGGLKPVIMSDRNPGIVAAVAQVFGKEYHSYCLRHVTENFLKEVGKLSIRKEAMRKIVKEMLYRVAYAPTAFEYNAALEELRCYKVDLGQWVEEHEPEHWANSKFGKEMWGRMNSNVIES